MFEELMAQIRYKLLTGNYVATDHFVTRCRERGLSVTEVVGETAHGRIIEDYPEDQRGHSCLILARCGEYSLHVVVGIAYVEIHIITVYRPDPEAWSEGLDRRR